MSSREVGDQAGSDDAWMPARRVARRENISALRIAAPVEPRLSSSRTSLREIGDGLAVPMRCRRGQEIYCQDGAAANWYRLVSGAARRFSVRMDGRRQIVDLLVPGDTFGFGVRGRHR